MPHDDPGTTSVMPRPHSSDVSFAFHDPSGGVPRHSGMKFPSGLRASNHIRGNGSGGSSVNGRPPQIESSTPCAPSSPPSTR
jgi:hypothetical protein